MEQLIQPANLAELFIQFYVPILLYSTYILHSIAMKQTHYERNILLRKLYRSKG